MNYNYGIFVEVNFSPALTISGNYVYEVYERLTSTSTETLIFKGNTFIFVPGASLSSKKFDITDIVSNRGWNCPEINNMVDGRVNLLNKYCVKIKNTDNTVVATSGYGEVFLMSTYPNGTLGMIPISASWDYESTLMSDIIDTHTPLIQGYRYEGLSVIDYLVPKLPYIAAPGISYPFVGISSMSTNSDTFPIGFNGTILPQPGYVTQNITNYSPSWVNVLTLADLFDNTALNNTPYVEEAITDNLSNYATPSVWTEETITGDYLSYLINETPINSFDMKIIVDFNDWSYAELPLPSITVSGIIISEQIIQELSGYQAFKTAVEAALDLGKTIDDVRLYLYKSPQGTTLNYIDLEGFDDILEDTPIKLSLLSETVGNGRRLKIGLFKMNPKPEKAYIRINGYDTVEVDTCPSRYYLMWQDRAGGFQCQPFEKTETYSETYKRNEWATYQNAKRLGSIEIQPQWKLNSGWIEDWKMKYYESLYISSNIYLIDTFNQTQKRVYLSDNNFTEKTFKNQGRKLFNIEVTVKMDKPQQIIY